MDFLRFVVMDMLGDGFTVAVFSLVAIGAAVVVRDAIKYGWNLEEEVE
jgi:hypothetical protein